jgi:DNA-binding NarL/FixJ family response regulator
MTKQIAAALGIHERTVKLHRQAITTKLGVHGSPSSQRSRARRATAVGQW